MRTKRKNYDDYHSSDFDYGEDDFNDGDEDDELEEDNDDRIDDSDVASEYGVNSADEKGTKKKASSRRKGVVEQEEEDTYEDEDPFSPEIDLILSDKQVEVPV